MLVVIKVVVAAAVARCGCGCWLLLVVVGCCYNSGGVRVAVDVGFLTGSLPRLQCSLEPRNRSTCEIEAVQREGYIQLDGAKNQIKDRDWQEKKGVFIRETSMCGSCGFHDMLQTGLVQLESMTIVRATT